ncbi:MAG: ASKHA domain-containing protein [Terrimicrobiaceae bacterium]
MGCLLCGVPGGPDASGHDLLTPAVNSPAEIEVWSSGESRILPVLNPEQSLASLLADAGFALNTRCGQRGLCHGCEVELQTNPPQIVRACCQRPPETGRLILTIPARSLLSHAPAIVSDFRTRVPAGNDPIFKNGPPLGLAVDLGTTTVAVLLAELATGKVLARATALNAQVGRGDNVLTRIHLCQSEKKNIRRLQNDFWQLTFQPLLKEVLTASGQSLEAVAGVVVAGNTTMLHLACGEDPTPLGRVPFTPAFLERRDFPEGFPGIPRPVIFLPGLSAYVGADISAGAVCCGLPYASRPQLLVDVGTNGEILLQAGETMRACATAAGPAFEGCGLLCGMRAASGVISRIRLSNDPYAVTCTVLGGQGSPPHGITGSAYVDFLAEGRDVGLLTEHGRFERSFVKDHPENFRQEENGLCFLLDPQVPDLRIGEVDIALLLQAKAAIAAGIETLLALANVEAGDIETLHLAGGFGLHLSIPHATRCGLLPGFREEQISPVGNTSLGGAYLAMLDQSLAEEMDRLKAGIIELNLDPGFEDRYLDHLALPAHAMCAASLKF